VDLVYATVERCANFIWNDGLPNLMVCLEGFVNDEGRPEFGRPERWNVELRQRAGSLTDSRPRIARIAEV